MRSSILALLLVLVFASGALADGGRLPLGPSGLPERRTTEILAPGVSETTIVRGRRSARDVFTVEAAFVASRTQADAAARRLAAEGWQPRTIRVDDRAPDDPGRGPLGFSIRVGAFAAQADADALKPSIVAAGFPAARTLYTGDDGGPTSGPWVVHVLSIDTHRFGGRLVPALGTDIVPGRELLTEPGRSLRLAGRHQRRLLRDRAANGTAETSPASRSSTASW